MKYVIEVPTIETLETLTATAHRKGQAWILENVCAEMENAANLGEESYTLDLDNCPFKIDDFDVNEVQNTLREMNYFTNHAPRKRTLMVSWSFADKKNLQTLKDNNVCWRFKTRKESQEEMKALGFYC